jgi:type I restriction enzyme S subunit
MEVRHGYKQTEIGVIPEDWEAEGLGRYWTVTDCKHVTAQFVPQGFPIASIMEVQKRFVDLTNANQTTAHFYNLLIEGGRKPRRGDLILSRNATVGEVAQVAEWHPPFAMGQDVCLLRKKASDNSTEFLQAVFRSRVILKQLADLMVGSTFKRANVQQIRNFVVPMPPPPEQRAIAAALTDGDALLDGLDRLIAKKRDLKQAAMQELLTGQTRLPGFTGKWEGKRLVEVAQLNRLNVVPASQPDESFVHFSLPAFDAGKQPVTESGSSIGSNKFRVPENAVMVSKLNPRISRVWAPTAVPANSVASTEWLVLTPRVGTDREFLFTICCSPAFCEQMELAATGTTGSHQRISPNTALNIRVAMPVDRSEQSGIAAVLSDMDAELLALEARRDKTRALKQGMMQELLTGKTRLVPAGGTDA